LAQESVRTTVVAYRTYIASPPGGHQGQAAYIQVSVMAKSFCNGCLAVLLAQIIPTAIAIKGAMDLSPSIRAGNKNTPTFTNDCDDPLVDCLYHANHNVGWTATQRMEAAVLEGKKKPDCVGDRSSWNACVGVAFCGCSEYHSVPGNPYCAEETFNGIPANDACYECGSCAAKIVDLTATGDPHISNMRGEHFDIYQPGVQTLLHLPRHANLDNTLLFVEADARRMRSDCDVYFHTVTISGILTNQSSPIKFFANPHGNPPGIRWKEWVRFGSVEIRVVHRAKDIDYLDFFAKVDAQVGYDIGGLLGIDDHAAVATRPHECSHRHRAMLSSFAEASKQP